MKLALIFVSLIGWFNLLFGQEPHYIYYTTEDGLPNSTIYQVKQDRNNNIWFATGGGVSKYNGESFRNYSSEDGLDTYSVLSIHEDIDGKLYFISIENSIYVYNSNLDRMEIIPLVGENKELRELNYKNMCSFHVRKNGEFEMGYSISEGYSITKRDGVIKFYNDTTNGGVHIKSIGRDILFYSADSLNYITINGKKSLYNNLHIHHLKATSLSNDCIVLGQGNQLTLIDKNSIVETKKFKKTIIEVNSDKKNNIWVSFYRGGTICYTIVENKLIEKKHFLKKYSVTAVLEDHEGGYWFSTIENGVYYTPNIDIKFFNSDSGLSGLNVTGIIGDGENEVVVGYSDGSITVFRSDSIFRVFDNIQEIALGHTTVNHLVYDSLNNQYLISDYGAPIVLKNGELSLSGIKSVSCSHLLPDNIENGFWYKNSNSVGYVNNGSLIYEYPSEKANPFNLLYDFDGNVMEGANFSTKRYTREEQMEQEVKIKTNLLISDNYSINDSIYIRHTMYGIEIFQPNRKASFLNKNGKTFTQIVYDSKNEFWGASNHGLSKLRIEGDSISSENFSKEIGVLNNELKGVYKLKEKLWVHARVGLYIVDKKDIVSIEPMAPSVNSITSVDSIYRNPEENLTFKSNENNLIFKLQAITFKYKGEYKFEYKLDGINEEYTELGGNELNLTNLDYGHYTLNYRIKTVNGIYSPSSTYLFQIFTPFWATWWFIATIGIAFLIAIYFIVKKIFNQVLLREKKKSEMKELIHSLRLQSIQSQFNPHFTFNAVSSIQHHISASTINEAKSYLGMFSSIMRSILMNSEKETIPLVEELKLLQTYLDLEKLRFKDKLNYEFRIAPSVDPEYDRIPPMIIQPILENAINYGLFNKPKGGTILIDFNVIDDVLHCGIEDDGIGFEAVKKIQEVKRTKSSGKGLNLVKERLGVNNKIIKDCFQKIDLFDDNGLAVGTKIILKIELND